MANYYCNIRSNYFHVKDIEQFKALMDRVYCGEGDVELWEKKDTDNIPIFAFGCSGGISGVKNAEEDICEDANDSAYDEFINGLQDCVAENDAIIILESGHEKLCYLVGTALIITSQNCESLDISHIACTKAAEMLGNPEWQTACEY